VTSGIFAHVQPWLKGLRVGYATDDVVHIGAGAVMLVLVGFRCRNIGSFEDALEVGVDDEWCFQLFGYVGEFHGGLGWEDGLLPTMHEALTLMILQQTLPLEAVQAEAAEEVLVLVFRHLSCKIMEINKRGWAKKCIASNILSIIVKRKKFNSTACEVLLLLLLYRNYKYIV
jgi:hypothetical protein